MPKEQEKNDRYVKLGDFSPPNPVANEDLNLELLTTLAIMIHYCVGLFLQVSYTGKIGRGKILANQQVKAIIGEEKFGKQATVNAYAKYI